MKLPDTITIYIRPDYKYEDIPLEVKPSFCLDDLKSMIELMDDVPKEDQQFIYEGNHLSDDKTLS